jgi:hypothetical protein
MVKVAPKVDRHSGQVLLSITLNNSIAEVVDVVDLTMDGVVIKHLLWVPQSVWDLVRTSETRWLKRAMAFLNHIQIITVLRELPFHSQHIKVIRLMIFLSVHHLTKTLSTPLSVEEVATRTSEAEVKVVVIFNSVVATITVIIIMVVKVVNDLLLITSTSLQVQKLVARRRRSAVQIPSVLHQMVQIMKIVKKKSTMLMRKHVLLLCLAQIPHCTLLV